MSSADEAEVNASYERMVQAVDKNIMTSLIANSQEEFSPPKAIEAVGSSNEEDSGCGDEIKQKLQLE